MRKRDRLSNPYSVGLVGLDPDDARSALSLLLAGAVTAGVVVGGTLVVGGTALADAPGDDSHDSSVGQPDPADAVDATPVLEPADDPGVGTAADVDESGQEPDRVDQQQADQLVSDAEKRLDREERGFEQRIVAIRAELDRRQEPTAAPAAPDEQSALLDSVQQRLVDAEEVFHSFWEPAGAGIVEFVRSIADLAVQVDAEPADPMSDPGLEETPGPGVDGLRLADRPLSAEQPPVLLVPEFEAALRSDEPVLVLAPDPATSLAESGLVGSPALTGSPDPGGWEGHDLLDWGARWADTLTGNLADSVDRLLDDLEIALFGTPADGDRRAAPTGVTLVTPRVLAPVAAAALAGVGDR